MDTSTHTDSPGSAEPTSAAIASAANGQPTKHFDAFETSFFQQGEDASALGGDGTYDDSLFGKEKRRLLSYRSLVGLTGASSALAIVACIALFRSNAPSSSPLAAKVAPARPTLALRGTSPGAPSTGTPEPTVPAAAAPSAGELAPPSGGSAAVAAATPTATSAPSVSASVAPAPNAEPSAPKVATASASKDDTPKLGEPKADSPKEDPPIADQPKQQPQLAAAAPPRDGDARERCRQSVRSRRAKEISVACAAAFEEDATDADAAIAVARVELDRGRFAQASTWSKKAIAVSPDSADAYVLAGGAEQNQGHGKAAKEAYLRYLRLAPSGRYAAEIRAIVNSL